MIGTNDDTHEDGTTVERVHNPRPRGSESIADLLVRISDTPPGSPATPKAKLSDLSSSSSSSSLSNGNAKQQESEFRLSKITEEEAEGGNGFGANSSEPRKYKLSALRWPMLIAFCTIGYMNGISNEHGSILNVYMETLDIRIVDYVLLNQMFFFVPFVTSFLSAVLIDRFGSKLAIYITLALAGVRNASRALLFSRQTPGWQQMRFVYWGGQRLFTALTVGFYFCLPLKLSENWFPEEERSLALSLCAVIPILGTATASLTYPRFVVDAASAQPLAYINIIAFLVALAVVCLFVHRSKPAEGPPSERAETNASRAKERAESAAGEPSLWSQLGGVVRQSDLMIQLVATCIYESSFIVIITILQDIMTSSGMSRVFTGQFMAFNAVLAGSVQLGVSKWLRPKKGSRDPYFTRTCKLLLIAKLTTFVCFAMSLTLREVFGSGIRREGVELDWIGRNQWWIVVVCTVCYLVTKFCAAPYFNEQLAEIIRGSVSEATTSACQAATTNILYHTLLFLFVQLRQPGEQTEVRVPATAAAVVDLDGGVEQTPGEDEVLLVMEPARYLRSAMLISLVACATSGLYLAKFDTDMQKRNERLARAAGNKLASATATAGIVTNGNSASEKPTSGGGGPIEMIEMDTNDERTPPGELERK